jgi:hypothetical protein
MSGRFRTRQIFLAVLFLGLAAMAARNVSDPDLWWHLKAGQYIIAHKTIPHTDPFSYTGAGQPWVAHEWLSELFLYGLYRTGGWAGLILVFAAITAATFFLLYLRCPETPYVAAFGIVWGTLAEAPSWGVRPQTLAWLLVSLWLLILDRSQQNRRLLWWTLPLMLLWVNLHASYALGLAILAVFIIAELLEVSLGLLAVPQARPHLQALALTFLLNLILVPLNPNGVRLYSYPIETLRSQTMQDYIAEWFSPNLHSAEFWPFLLLLLGTIAALAWISHAVRVHDVLLLLASAYAALFSTRMIPFFVLIAVPMVSRQAHCWIVLGKSGNTAWPATASGTKPHRTRFLPKLLFNTAMAAAMIVFVCLRVARVLEQQPLVEQAHFPVGTVKFFKMHPADGPIFNHYDWGGYLIWKLYPDTRVFIDGRADLYGEHLLRQFADTFRLKGDWKQTLNQWHVKTVLVPRDSALAQALSREARWTISYEDQQAVIFRDTGRVFTSQNNHIRSGTSPGRPLIEHQGAPARGVRRYARNYTLSGNLQGIIVWRFG